MIELSNLPSNPGSYLFKNKKGIIIYVGKAKNLKKRVSSYFQKRDYDSKTKTLVENISSVDFIVTDTEVEALILENNLIKKHLPKYNVLLKDAKRYAYIKLTDEEFPRLELARTKEEKGKFFGPFISAETRTYVLETVRKIFMIRTCKKLPKKACLRYHINLCSAPCVKEIDYETQIKNAELVLRGKTSMLVKRLEKEMKEESSVNNFEGALVLRNQINAINWLSEKQKVERQKTYDEDIINYFIKEGKVYLILFNIYKGILENKQSFEFDYNENFLEEFIIQYYSENKIPKELILPKAVDDSLVEFLEKTNGSKVKITVPKSAGKKQLLSLVKKNIELTFFGEIEKLEDLKQRLKLNETPTVIECFDISHLSGTSTVASMVQFRNAKADKSNYRKFKIRTVGGIDDFLSIKEVVKRRYSRLLNENKEFPNLIVIDGGKGQLTSAMDALKELGIRIPIISIAKKFEEIYFPGSRFPLRLDHKTKALNFLQEIRDEAHRFAISYNRLLRTKELLM